MSRRSARISSKADGNPLPQESLVGTRHETEASNPPIGSRGRGHPQKYAKQSVEEEIPAAKAGYELEHAHVHQPEPEGTLLLTLLTPLTPSLLTFDTLTADAPTPSLGQTPLLAANTSSGNSDNSSSGRCQGGLPDLSPHPEIEATDTLLPAGPPASSGRRYGTRATNDPHPALTAGLGKRTRVEISAGANQKRAERQAMVDQQRAAIENERREMEKKIRALADFEQSLHDLDERNDALFKAAQHPGLINGAEGEDQEGQDINMEDSPDTHQIEADGDVTENTRRDNMGAQAGQREGQREAFAAVGDGQGVRAGEKRKLAPNPACAKVC